MSPMPVNAPRSKSLRIAVSVCTLLSLLLTASCSDDSGDSPNGEVTPDATETPDAGPPPWVEVTERVSGATFMFPSQVRPTNTRKTLSNGIRSVSHAYQDSSNGVVVVVKIITGNGDVSSYDPKSILDSMAPGLTSVGARDAKMTKVHSVNVPGGEAAEGTLSFTSEDGQPNYWRLRLIESDDEKSLTYLQTITFAGPKQLAARQAVDKTFRKLASGFSL